MSNPFMITYGTILKELDRELVNLMEIKQQAIRNGSENLNGLTFRIEGKEADYQDSAETSQRPRA
jgi:hypothetical protein